MENPSSNWQRVASAGDIQANQPIVVNVEGEEIALFNVAGDIYATHAICTHAYACLAEGYQEGDIIECPLHEGRFHIPTGKALSAPAATDVITFPVKVVDDDVFVDIA